MSAAPLRVPPALASLAAQPRWCAWKSETGRKEKTPFIDIRRPGRSDVPHVWLTAERALGLVAVFEDQGATCGLGLLLVTLPNGWRLVCIDLDAAVDDDGNLAPWAAGIVARFAGHWMEVSPSGRGLHIMGLVDEDMLRAAGCFRPDGSLPARICWKEAAPDGGKAPGIDLLLGGYTTVTGAELPDAPAALRPLDLPTLTWLINEAGPQIAAEAPQPPAMVSGLSTPSPRPIAGAARDAGRSRPGIRLSRSRVLRFAVDRTLSDAAFQCLFALWGAAGRGADGWAPVSIAVTTLASMPGARAGKRRSRLKMREARAELEKRELLRTTAPAVPPSDAGAGVVTQREVVAPFVAGKGEDPADNIIRLPRDVLARMLALPPRRLRLLAWIIAAFPADQPFTLSAASVAATLGGKHEVRAADLAALAADACLVVVEPPDRVKRTAGRYRHHHNTTTPGTEGGTKRG